MEDFFWQINKVLPTLSFAFSLGFPFALAFLGGLAGALLSLPLLLLGLAGALLPLLLLGLARALTLLLLGLARTLSLLLLRLFFRFLLRLSLGFAGSLFPWREKKLSSSICFPRFPSST